MYGFGEERKYMRSYRLNTFFLRNNLLASNQSGYRKDRNCLTVLIDVIEEIRVGLDSNQISFLTLLVDHKTL